MPPFVDAWMLSWLARWLFGSQLLRVVHSTQDPAMLSAGQVWQLLLTCVGGSGGWCRVFLVQLLCGCPRRC